ncbi:MAG: CocE/NonD family hydrolase [Candidatus Aminicenantes bacterium]|nr:CocE/NonD family hydrolase [Candidatus Aminicenantes bacterium]
MLMRRYFILGLLNGRRFLLTALFGLFCLVQLANAQIRHKFDVRIPMRDGVKLSADVWMPQEEGKYPAVLIRLPYLKTMREAKFPDIGKLFASQGYVFVVQDCRGRGDSEGEFDFYFTDGKDGYDSIEWIAAQPWCDGKVGMMGLSYLGAVQWLAAREKPPHLVCITPTAPSGRYFDELPYNGGAWLMQWALTWLNGVSAHLSQDNSGSVDWERVLKHRPLISMDEAMGRHMRLYKEWLEHSTIDDYWKRILFTQEDFSKVDLPALHVTGWFDGDQPGALSFWDGMNEFSPGRDRQYLLIGPWTHGQTLFGGALKIGEMEFSSDSVIDRMAQQLAFFEHYLKGTAPEFDHPRVKVYLTGSNEWLELEDYPPPQVQNKPFYFHSGGKSNTLLGDGTLSRKMPEKEPVDKYIFDPKKPIQFGMEEEMNAVDNRLTEIRSDVLVYTSEELTEPVSILGRVFVHLYAASDALDTDFTAKLLDVYPDGRALNLGPNGLGIRRARYRNGYAKEELLTPNKPEKFTIELFDIGHTFLPGHKIRVEISSSASPMFNPNQNTGNPVATDTEWKTANQTIYHDSGRPSHVVLPVLPKSEK